MKTYKIIRFRFKGKNRTIKTGLSLEKAQAHCKDPKSSGNGWFDGTLKKTNTNMKIKKPNKLVKTDKQEESAYIVFWSIIVGGILLAVTIISHYL